MADIILTYIILIIFIIRLVLILNKSSEGNIRHLKEHSIEVDTIEISPARSSVTIYAGRQLLSMEDFTWDGAAYPVLSLKGLRDQYRRSGGDKKLRVIVNTNGIRREYRMFTFADEQDQDYWIRVERHKWYRLIGK